MLSDADYAEPVDNMLRRRRDGLCWKSRQAQAQGLQRPLKKTLLGSSQSQPQQRCAPSKGAKLCTYLR